MKTRIVRIGNSRGIRIPKPLIEQTGLEGEVEVEAEENRLIIRPAQRPRSRWASAFEAMAAAGDDSLIDGDGQLTNHGDEEEWEWK